MILSTLIFLTGGKIANVATTMLHRGNGVLLVLLFCTKYIFWNYYTFQNCSHQTITCLSLRYHITHYALYPIAMTHEEDKRYDRMLPNVISTCQMFLQLLVSWQLPRSVFVLSLNGCFRISFIPLV